MKARAATTPTHSRSTIALEAQPSRWPSAMPVISPSSAVQSSAKPSQSNGGISLGSGRVGMNSRPSTAASAQNGSEMKNTYRQEKYSIISPPSVGAEPPSSAPIEKNNSEPTKVRRSPSTPVIQALISMPAVMVAM